MDGAKAWVNVIIPDAENREKDDFYETPPEGTQRLLGVEKFSGAIWEPACGRGAISEVLKASSYDVISTDLVDRQYGEPRVDFLMETKLLAPNVVTNPPFKLAQEFAQHALDLGAEKVAMLARLAWLEGKERRKFFESTPLARVWVFSGRIAITRSGELWRSSQGGMIAFAWYVWERSHVGSPTLGWI